MMKIRTVMAEPVLKTVKRTKTVMIRTTEDAFKRAKALGWNISATLGEMLEKLVADSEKGDTKESE